MKQATTTTEGYAKRATGADDRIVAPLEVFYVVETTGKVIGKRRHRIRSLFYETRPQAQAELLQLQAASACADDYGVWKSTTYIEPAEWLRDVVMKDGTLIRAKPRSTRRRSAANTAEPFML